MTSVASAIDCSIRLRMLSRHEGPFGVTQSRRQAERPCLFALCADLDVRHNAALLGERLDALESVLA